MIRVESVYGKIERTPTVERDGEGAVKDFFKTVVVVVHAAAHEN